MENLSVQAVESDFDVKLKYAQANGFGLEIATFAFPEILDTRWRKLLNYYRKRLKGFPNTISMHGAFIDLILNSKDNEVRKVAEERIKLNLKIAKRIGAKYIVFHGNFNPMITSETYRGNWIKANALFWKSAIKKYGVTVCLENLWEKDPSLFRELLDAVKSPKLKVCFDTGHTNIFSEAPMKSWFSVLGKDIAYVHAHDNKGKVDNELVPGEGTINWRSFSKVIKESRLSPKVIFEVGTMEKTVKSVEYFRKNKIYPF